MEFLKPLEMNEAPEGSRDVLSSVEDHGGVSNLLRVLAHSPSALRAFVAMNKLVEDCDMSPAERRVALLAASAANGCEYCLAADAADAGRAGLDEETVQAIRDGEPIENNERFESLRVFVTGMVERRGRLSDEEVRDFIEADFQEGNIVDIAFIVAMKTLSNYVNHIARTPLDEVFADIASHPSTPGVQPHGVTH
ncbi:MAG TPA: carboxymuconolactone decarboxylase family protein [Gammaproteobacteria bacterium]|nr:carboxymuconolactone decarboxylase family protein [Gammaproteobacteria bacterium]